MNLMQNIRALIKQAEEVQAQPNLVTEQNAATAGAQLAINAQALQSGATVEQQQVESLQKGLATASAEASGEDKVVQLQKAAALVELVSNGSDFYDAVDQVYSADMEMQKVAAFDQLRSEGVSFDEAVDLINKSINAAQ